MLSTQVRQSEGGFRLLEDWLKLEDEFLLHDESSDGSPNEMPGESTDESSSDRLHLSDEWKLTGRLLTEEEHFIDEQLQVDESE